jgi:acyl-CoA reductase-like NAD-dependent aldehyde dehydrogenase
MMALPMKPLQDSPELLKALADAKELWEKMTPEQREEMLRKQRESWTLQDMD